MQTSRTPPLTRIDLSVPAGTSSPAPVPGGVAYLQIVSVTSNSITISWSAPVYGAAVGNYNVEYRTPSGTGAWTSANASVSATATNYTITGLVPLTTYDVQIFATNSASGVPESGVPDVLTNVSTTS